MTSSANCSLLNAYVTYGIRRRPRRYSSAIRGDASNPNRSDSQTLRTFFPVGMAQTSLSGGAKNKNSIVDGRGIRLAAQIPFTYCRDGRYGWHVAVAVARICSKQCTRNLLDGKGVAERARSSALGRASGEL